MRPFENQNLLIVEDDYLLADDLARQLTGAGANVLGPVATPDRALRLLETVNPDAAVLDVNLRGEMSLPVADMLTLRGVPFVFATGYDRITIPARYAHIPYLEKPYDLDSLLACFPLAPPGEGKDPCTK